MSVKALGQVWELTLPHQELLILLALADHADHEGRHVRPSLALIAWKTGYSKRQVIRVMQTLESKRLIRVSKEGGGRGRTTEYTLLLHNGVKKSPFINGDMVTQNNEVSPTETSSNETNSDTKNGDTMTPFAENGDTMTPFAENGDTMTPFGPQTVSDKMSETVTIATSKGDIAMSPQPSENQNQDLNPPPLIPPSTPRKREVSVRETDAIDRYEATLATHTPGFQALCAAYPAGRQEGIHEAWHTWRALDLEPRTSEIVAKVTRLVETAWKDREPRFIPLLRSWLDKGRYNDPLVPVTATSKPRHTLEM